MTHATRRGGAEPAPPSAEAASRPSRPHPRRRRLLLLGVLVLVALGAAGRTVPGVLGALGGWLIRNDPLQPADVIFVHGGHVPFRALEAAELFHSGAAPEVWVARSKLSLEAIALRDLGIDVPASWQWNQEILLRSGVPPEAIRVLAPRVANTRDEIEAVAAELRRTGRRRAILVTSKQHSRRVGLLWERLAPPDLTAIVRASASDPFDPQRWWRNTEDLQAGLHELAGIADVWLDFGLRPER